MDEKKGEQTKAEWIASIAKSMEEDLDAMREARDRAIADRIPFAEKYAKPLAVRIEQLEDTLSELVDLMEGVRTGEYTPDSFTCQPARNLLAGKTKPSERIRNLKRAAKEAERVLSKLHKIGAIPQGGEQDPNLEVIWEAAEGLKKALGGEEDRVCAKCGTVMEYKVMTEAQLDWYECPNCGEKVYPQAEDEEGE